MGTDDKLEKALERLADESQAKVVDETLAVTIAAIPGVGGPIGALLSGEEKRRVVARAVEVFRIVKERLEAVEESKLDKNFVECDGFQVVMRLTLEQLQTTDDAMKLRALADGLANSSLLDFSAESRKELFFRILRDLAPNDFHMLKSLVPKAAQREASPDFWPTIHQPLDEELAILQRLEAHALVNVSFKGEAKISGPRYGNAWTPSEAERAIKEALETPPSRHYKISKFGLEFLRFFGQFEKDSK